MISIRLIGAKQRKKTHPGVCYPNLMLIIFPQSGQGILIPLHSCCTLSPEILISVLQKGHRVVTGALLLLPAGCSALLRRSGALPIVSSIQTGLLLLGIVLRRRAL